MPEDDLKKSDPRPVSPQGERFHDMHPVFTLLRQDYAKTLSRIPDAETAMDFLLKVRHEATRYEQIHQHSHFGKYNKVAVDFFTSESTDKEFWHALFTMLKESDFKDKNEIRNTASTMISKFTRDGKTLSIKEREDIGQIAREALEEVYK